EGSPERVNRPRRFSRGGAEVGHRGVVAPMDPAVEVDDAGVYHDCDPCQTLDGLRRRLSRNVLSSILMALRAFRRSIASNPYRFAFSQSRLMAFQQSSRRYSGSRTGNTLRVYPATWQVLRGLPLSGVPCVIRVLFGIVPPRQIVRRSGPGGAP